MQVSAIEIMGTKADDSNSFNECRVARLAKSIGGRAHRLERGVHPTTDKDLLPP